MAESANIYCIEMKENIFLFSYDILIFYNLNCISTLIINNFKMYGKQLHEFEATINFSLR